MYQNSLYHIYLSKDQELHNDFLDLFTKYVVNSNQTVFFDHFGSHIKYFPYGEVYKFLIAHPQQQKTYNDKYLNRNPLSNRNNFHSNNSFAFEACNTSITILLDLSPYMLNFQYQSKSTPLANLQMVLKDILTKIRQKKQDLIKLYKKISEQNRQYDWKVQFNLTIYFFSVYEPIPFCVLYRQDINYTSFTHLNDFILSAIYKSNLPYEKRSTKYTISDLIQKILDVEQPLLGIRSILVVSSFNQKQSNSRIFFTSNWYTYSFINVGTNMGSYLIQQKQIISRYGSSPFFQLKYVYFCQFIQNWEKVDRMQSNSIYSFLPIKTQRHKTILYFTEGKPVKNIINQILKFKLSLRNRQSTNSLHQFAKGQNSSIKFLDFPKKEYKINQQNFSYILRARYQQGWEPIYHEKKQQKMTKCIFKLDFNPYLSLLYKADLFITNEGKFYSIQIGTKVNQQFNIKKIKYSTQNDQTKYKQRILDLIQNIDIICTSHFKSLKTSLLYQIGGKRKSMLNPFNLNLQYEQKALKYVLNNPDEWGKFSKIKYVYFNFVPLLNRSFLEQFLNQISFFLGQRISQSIFIKKGFDKIEKTKSLKQHKLQFTQLIRKYNIIKIKLAYINYSFKQIKNILEPFIYKFQTKKFKSGEAMIVNEQLFKFSHLAEDNSNEKMFKNIWKLRIKNNTNYRSFIYYFNSLIKAEGFQQIGQRRINKFSQQYVKRIFINQAKQQNLGADSKKSQSSSLLFSTQRMIQKAIYCKIQFLPHNELNFNFLMFPLIGKLAAFVEEINQNIDTQIQVRKYIDSKKQISAYDFFCKYTENIKYSQSQILKIINNYNLIHESLLLKLVQQNINQRFNLKYSPELKIFLKHLYYQKGNNFENEYLIFCQQILTKYYSYENQNFKKQKIDQIIDIDIIPQPQKFFISADVSEIKGDLNIKKKDKQYIFYLFSPFRPIYICQKQNKFYYKDINLMYEDINIQQASHHSIQLMINQISLIIQKEQYKKLYLSIFYSQKLNQNSEQTERIFKKIQNFNQPFQKCLEIKNSMGLFIYQIDKNENSMNQDDLKLQRKLLLLKQYENIYFEIINFFFDRQQHPYYFQRKNYENSKKLFDKYNLNLERLQDFNYLIIKNYFKSSEKIIYISQNNFRNILNQNSKQLASDRSKIILVCYSQLQGNSNKKNNFEYLLQCLNQLCNEFYLELFRIKIHKLENLEKINEIQSNMYLKVLTVPISTFYNEISLQRLSKYIQCPLMQKNLPFKKIPNHIYRYIVARQIKQTKKDNNQAYFSIFIPFWIFLQLHDNKINIKYSQYRFFQKNQKISEKVNIYIEQLINYINSDMLLNQMNEQKYLPLQPHELFISPIVNNPLNKLVETKKKTGPIKKTTKGIRAKIESQRQQNTFKKSQLSQSINKTKPMPLLFKNYTFLNQRFRPNDGLEAIKKYQSFQVFVIMNLKNTYLFPNFINKQNIIFHFQQQQYDKICKDIHQNDLLDVQFKPKRVLISYAHSLNIFINKNQIQTVFKQIIKQALNQKNFQSLSHQLYIAPQIIQPVEQKDLKLGQKKIFSFDIPFIPFVDDFKGYVKQHILMYHTKTQFKSQKVKIKRHQSLQENFKNQKSQTISKSKQSFHKIQDSKLKEKSNNKQSFRDLNNSVNISYLYDNKLQSRQSFLSVDQRKKIFLSTMEKQQCEKCIPTMWLFNFKKNMKLQAKFGKCVYLLKLQITHNVNTTENVQIWQKVGLNKKNKQYIGYDLTDEDKDLLNKYLNGVKLFSSQKDVESKIFKTTVTFNIIHWLGNPIFNAMEQVFSSIIRTSISDYYIQNTLNYWNLKSKTRKKIISYKSIEEQNINSKHSNSFNYPLEEINLIKSKSESVLLMNTNSTGLQSLEYLQSGSNQNQRQKPEHIINQFSEKNIDKIYQQILIQSETVDKIIQVSTNQSLFKIKCFDELLIKDIKTYFKDFYFYLANNLLELVGKNLPIIFYVQFVDSTQPKVCWIDQLYNKQQNFNEKLNKFLTKFQKIMENKKFLIAKLGFIINQQFFSYLQKYNKQNNKFNSEFSQKQNLQIETNSSINIQGLERCKIFLEEKSFCLTEYYFTRSLYIHYEISYEGFKYYSYNLNIFLNNKVSQFLLPLQNWLQEKYRLLKFIKSIKQRQIYELIPSQNIKKTQTKFGFIFQLYLQTLKNNKKQQDDKRIKYDEIKSVSLSKILISLVFDEYPLKYQDGSLMNLSKQINDIFQILKNTPVQYKGMPEYKGKQKFLLQKLGRQYISYLRHQHGWKQVQPLQKKKSAHLQKRQYQTHVN